MLTPAQIAELDDIKTLLVSRIDDLFRHFSIEYTIYNNRVSSKCPIHESKGEDKLSVYLNGQQSVGNWRCWSNECHTIYGGNIFGLIRGILSTRLNREVTFGEAIKWSKQFLGITRKSRFHRDDDSFDSEWNEKHDFILVSQSILKDRRTTTGAITRNQIRKNLVIPADYYLQRGYSKDILDKYDIGFCATRGKEMSYRVVVPIYDDNYEYMIGCAGRSIQPKCEECKYHHFQNRACPSNKLEKKWGAKWINNSGFNAESYLYNFWFAKKFIEKTNTVVLVEGPGDIWRLEEAGIHIGLATFGDKITDEQCLILEKLPIYNIVLLYDNDDAGQRANKRIIEKLNRLYNLYPIVPPMKDVGEMQPAQLRDFLKPRLHQIVGK